MRPMSETWRRTDVSGGARRQRAVVVADDRQLLRHRDARTQCHLVDARGDFVVAGEDRTGALSAHQQAFGGMHAGLEGVARFQHALARQGHADLGQPIKEAVGPLAGSAPVTGTGNHRDVAVAERAGSPQPPPHHRDRG